MTENVFPVPGPHPVSLGILTVVLGIGAGIATIPLGNTALTILTILTVSAVGVLLMLPVFSRHRISGDHLVLSYWPYLRIEVPLEDITSVEQGEWFTSLGLNVRGKRLSILNSSVGMVRLSLRRPHTWMGMKFEEVVTNVRNPRDFAAAITGSEEAAEPPVEGVCPTCGRRLEEEAHPRIEGIFLIHRDGRMVTCYLSGRVKTKGQYSMTSMLTAIKEFVEEAFETRSTLKTLEHGDMKIVIETGEHVYLATMVSGPVPEGLRKVMRSCLSEIEGSFEEAGADWDGRLKNEKEIQKILSQVLWV